MEYDFFVLFLFFTFRIKLFFSVASPNTTHGIKKLRNGHLIQAEWKFISYI